MMVSKALFEVIRLKLFSPFYCLFASVLRFLTVIEIDAELNGIFMPGVVFFIQSVFGDRNNVF